MGLAVLGSLVAVVFILAPVYIDNYRLRGYVRDLAAEPAAAATSDEKLRAEVLNRARQLDLPVLAGDVHITHDGAKPHLNMKYKVKIDWAVYQVDLHMSAASR